LFYTRLHLFPLPGERISVITLSGFLLTVRQIQARGFSRERRTILLYRGETSFTFSVCSRFQDISSCRVLIQIQSESCRDLSFQAAAIIRPARMHLHVQTVFLTMRFRLYLDSPAIVRSILGIRKHCRSVSSRCRETGERQPRQNDSGGSFCLCLKFSRKFR